MNASRCSRFSDNLNRVGLLDIGTSGPKYTWSGHRNGSSVTKICLDRVVANMDWLFFLLMPLRISNIKFRFGINKFLVTCF